MGSYKPKPGRHGSPGQTQGVVSGIAGGALMGVLQHALMLILSALVPGLGPAVYAAFLIYKFGSEALKVKKDYDDASGTPEQKATMAAIKEGIRAGIGQLVGDVAGQPVEELARKTAYTTADGLAKEGTFKEVAHGMGLPKAEASDLQCFYEGALSRILEGAYGGAKDEISDYVAEEV